MNMSGFTRVGLTGGIASGKSLIAKQIARQGILVVDMDLLSKKILDTDLELQNEVKNLFGSPILLGDQIDRQKLRKAVFNDKSKKAQLEELIHPRVKTQFEELALKAQKEGRKVIICEAPLLIESGYRNHLDELIVVLAPLEARLSRLMIRDAISEDLALKMIKAQVSDDERRKHASIVIENNSSLQDLEKKVDGLISSWRKKGLCE